MKILYNLLASIQRAWILARICKRPLGYPDLLNKDEHEARLKFQDTLLDNRTSIITKDIK